MVEDTTFAECSNTSNGGSLYFKSNSHFIQDRSCYFKSDGNTLAYYIYTSDSSDMKLFFNLSTIYCCGRSITDHSHTIYVYQGPEKSSNINITQNKCNSWSGYVHETGNTEFKWNFNNVYKNSQTSAGTFHFDTNTMKYINNCNIIENTKIEVSSNAIISVNGDITFEACCIKNNKPEPLFSQYNGGFKIILLSCYFDSTKVTGAIIFTYSNKHNFLKIKLY